ncbi:histidine kinase dimerization/phosphoacceptor domain -containing protein [Brevundimonas sp. PAMC22021]|uniref:histidine kinase dimerization/phosphoacceptor domain -containing protein n=1 Tax=Brevundimonas sp. PAMC22021 TaxID=2861285 RepID=UPI001C635AAA|nr:histidine kinase dimerization/phosphoacceptor domain -containing protein [Brevundimonas sp. PAMC22021]QYF86201.1 GAF domain-containing protein [Brevundimonas sp. PAMC22021]
MTDAAVQLEPLLNDCDREPIHIPQAIQPHGFLLALERGSLLAVEGAGDIEGLTGVRAWQDQPVDLVLGDGLGRKLREMIRGGETGFVDRWRGVNRIDYDVIMHHVGDRTVVEVEQSSQAARLGIELVGRLDTAGAALERAASVQAVCEVAAEAFRKLTGFDRIMIYRFLDDDAGHVVAEAREETSSSFLNHHFPATDIPRQARALYVRNPVRVIPDAAYAPQPLRGGEGRPPLDMSDCGLRSVSPIHLQYLKNMGVRASASVSIVVDDALWGLIACHNERPKLLPYELRVASTTLARNLARQIKARAEAELYRERVRLRRLEDELLAALPAERPLVDGLGQRSQALLNLVAADGVAIVQDGRTQTFGRCPPTDAIDYLDGWVSQQPGLRPVASNSLSAVLPQAAAWTAHASGLLAVRVSSERPLSLLWFRSEIPETIRWAGDPSTAVKSNTRGVLTPRASFEDYTETVRGRARRWDAAAVESAARLRDALLDFSAVSQLRRMNQSLQASLTERDLRLEQQQYLIREVNHRVQNSLTLVSSFLGLQAREQTDRVAAAALQEARQRVRAVSAVHTRLYQDTQSVSVDLARYVDDLIEDLGASTGPEWRDAIETQLAPISVESGRSVTIGLILTELIINSQKYAYDGAVGSVCIQLSEPEAGVLRLSVQDRGRGGHQSGAGFGSMMIQSLVGQLGGTLDYYDRSPGLEAVLRARIDALT